MTEMAENLSGSFQETYVAMDETMHQALTADYRKTVIEAFRDVTRYLIRRYHVLNSLSEAGYLGHDTVIDGERLPSWAPDYSRPLVADAAIGLVSSFFAGFCLGYQQYLAPKYHYRLHQRTLDINVLSLDGFLVNRVGKRQRSSSRKLAKRSCLTSSGIRSLALLLCDLSQLLRRLKYLG
jgi:hypothetical protein